MVLDMGGNDHVGTSKSPKWSLRNRADDSLLLCLVGVVLVILATTLALLDKASVASVFGLIGAGSLVAAALVDRIEGTVEMGPLKLTLRAAVIAAVKDASVKSLQAALPLLQEEDVRVAIVGVPQSFDGRRLIDPELAFIRTKLQIAVIALRREDESKWSAGGKVSEIVLQAGMAMLVTGDPDLVSYFAALTAADDAELWRAIVPEGL